MSFLSTTPGMLAAAATDLENIGSTLSAANAAARPATAVAEAAADEVSVSIATMFDAYSKDFLALSARAATFHADFMQNLTATARRYEIAEAAYAARLGDAAQAALARAEQAITGHTDPGAAAARSILTRSTKTTASSTSSGSPSSGTATAKSGGGSGGTTVLSTPTATTTIKNAYVVQNNAWGDPSGGQAITVTRNGFTITAEPNSAPTTGAPLGYPSIYQGWTYGVGSPGNILPIQLSQIDSAVSSVNFTFPTSGNYNASYDIWLNPTPITTGVNQQEIMIWYNHVGPMQPYGYIGNSTIDGRNFAVYEGYNGYNDVVWYVSPTPISSWKNMDVLAFINHTATIQPVTNSWYLTSVQAGFEVWNGSVGASVNSFSSSINGAS